MAEGKLDSERLQPRRFGVDYHYESGSGVWMHGAPNPRVVLRRREKVRRRVRRARLARG